MLSTQEKKDKDQFFNDLYRLDHLDDDKEDTEGEGPPIPFKQSGPPPAKKSFRSEPSVEQLQRKRKSGEQDPKPAMRAVAANSETLKPPSSPVQATVKKKQERRTEPRRDVTDLSNLHQRKRQLKGRMKLKPIPLDQQMFRDFVFCTCKVFASAAQCTDNFGSLCTERRHLS
jgi:hypothetical protein